MGFLSHLVDRNKIEPGDHIYSWRTLYTYSHHGIYVGGSKVVHFTRDSRQISSLETSLSSLFPSSSALSPVCPNFPDCGFRQPNSGVVLSCLDCFLGSGSLYSFEYGVSPSVFLAKVRGGTCTTAKSDPAGTVIHRAMFLLQNGFGNYDLFQNNCEDFAMYCKTGLLILEKNGLGRSGQATSMIGAPLSAFLSSPLKLLIPGPVGVATAAVGMYAMSRYSTDIGVRTDVIKVAVEDMAMNLGWVESVDPPVEAASNELATLVELDPISVPTGQISRTLIDLDPVSNPSSQMSRTLIDLDPVSNPTGHRTFIDLDPVTNPVEQISR